MKPVLWQRSLTQLRHTLDDSADGTLLERFITHNDTDAFATLLQRHGPMVYGVCQRVLANHADTEDAFQTTFVVLVRKARHIRDRATLANWLYGVAHTTALKARAMRTKRTTKEAHVPPVAPVPEPANDWLPLLDEELARLPTIYRMAIVLCDLEGKTHKEASELLGCPSGTIGARIARGRRMLAERLSRRGLTLTVSALVATLSGPDAQALIAPTLFQATIDAARGPLSGPVAALTDKVVKTMFLKKIKVMASVFVVAAVTLVGLTPGQLPQAEAQSKEIAAKIENDINLKRLEGAWYPDQLVTPNGVKPYPLKGRALFFQKGEFFRLEGNQIVSSGKYKLEDGYLFLTTNDRNPWDLETGAVKATLQYTFKVEGDLLTVCYDTKKRTKADDLTPGASRQVTVYKREKGAVLISGTDGSVGIGISKGELSAVGGGLGGDALLGPPVKNADPLFPPKKADPTLTPPRDLNPPMPGGGPKMPPLPMPMAGGGVTDPLAGPNVRSGPVTPVVPTESQRLERLERELMELRKLLEDRLPKSPVPPAK